MVKASIVAFGVTHGYSSMKCNESQYKYLSSFYIPDTGTKMKTFRHKNGDVFYTYLIYPEKGKHFADYQGRTGAFFGMSLILKDNYIKKPEKVADFFQKLYNDHIKNKIIKEDSAGNRKFLVNNLSIPQIENYIVNAVHNTFSKYPELNFSNDIEALPLISPKYNAHQR